MRTARIVEDGAAYYHMMSRVVDRRKIFDDVEKEHFRKTLRAVEGFSGTRVVTWSVMDNHFHVLLHVPEREDVADGELIRRLLFLYDKALVGNLAAYLASLRSGGQDEAAELFKKQYTCRMHSLAEFGKTLKQRVSFSYNRRHQRKGTLWEERFKSVLVDGSPGTLTRMAAYIDLNAVRAGIVKDPKDYRFCGYGEAMGGSKEARAGLAVALGEAGDWSAVSGQYRQLLYVSGEASGVRADGRSVRAGFGLETVERVVALKGKLPLNEVLRCRVRYFTDGAILGSRAFVEEAFLRHRDHFSAKRNGGARSMKGGDWGDLYTARQLRVDIPVFPALA